MKILKNENWTAHSLSNFLREMSTLSSMRHPHIQSLIAGITDTKAACSGNGSLAIVTPLAINGDLRDVSYLHQFIMVHSCAPPFKHSF